MAPRELARRIDAYLQPLVESNNFTGVVFVARGDRVLFSKGYGMANYELNVPNTPAMRFHIASVSKSFTAAAILLLEERGKLSTSDHVSRFLPDYPQGDKIRLDQLLTHSSGVPNVNNFPEYGRESFFPHTVAQVVAMFKDKPLDFEPGTRFRYSNSNYNVLALIIEKVSGQSYGDFMRANIFEPLELTSTLHHGDAAQMIANRAVGTEPDGLRGVKFASQIDWSIKTGNGSLVTTAPDLCKFTRSLFEGKLLKPGSLAKVMQPGPAFPYGWDDRERFSHKIKGVGGRSPGFISNVEYFLDDQTCIAVLSNSYSPVTQSPVAPDISAVLYGQPTSLGSVNLVRPGPGEFAELAGRYQMPDNYFVPGATLTFEDRGDYLEAHWSNGATTIIYSVGGGRFLDRTNWAEIRFTRDDGGHVTGFIYNLTREFTVRRIVP